MSNLIKIGSSDVYSTLLGLGTNAVGGHNLYPGLNEETGKEVIRTALNNGINMLDTAFYYGLGRSEELIGEVLKEYKRQDVIIATKAAHDLTQNGNFNNSSIFLKQSVESALKRLKTDYIDIFYIHYPDKSTPKNEAVYTLKKLKDEGKIKAVGISNFNLEQIKEANKDGNVDIVENEYSLIHREAEKELMPYLKEHNISFIPYFPLVSGLLTGKYNKSVIFPKDDIRSKKPDFQGERFESLLKKVEQLKPLAEKYQVTITQIVLAWYIKNPLISVITPGAKKSEQILANVKAMNINLTDQDYQIIDQLFS